MAVPTAAVSAQVVQQKAQEQAQAPKQGPSAFDGHLEKAKGGGSVDATARAQATQAAQRLDHARAIAEVQKTDQAKLNKVSSNINSASQAEVATQKVSEREAPNKTTGFFKNLMRGIEDGEKHIQGMLDAKSLKWDQQTLIQMQAGMYKYTQELELTGKVVEKATSGLKDTLKTQV